MSAPIMLYFGPLWMLLLTAAYVNAVSYSNVIEEADDSIEDTDSQQHFYDTRYEEDDWNYYKKKQKKPTISEDAIFLAHEKYCQYFYAFDGRQSAIFKCASGYRFDVERSQCLKTKQVDCGKRKKSIDSSSSGSKSVRIDYKCPKWSGFFAHEYYCNLYYSCQNKKPELYMCPPGMLFDSENYVCTYREYVKCNKRVDPSGGDDNDLEIKPDPNEVFNCQQASGIFPHPTMCNKFVRCWFGYGDVLVCPKGYLYDIDLMQCRSKSLVHCQDRIDPHGYDDEEPPVLIDLFPDFECQVNKGRFPHEDCGQFYECENGEARLYACPPTKLYDTQKQTCKEASEVTCNRDDDGDDEDEEFICPAKEGIYKDSENCGSYYKCKQGKAQHLNCSEGELFDTDWKSCNDENEVICGDRLHPKDDPDDEQDDNIIDDNPSYECTKLHGRFTHEDICNWYYHCKDGRPSIRVCRSGRYYDQYRNYCYDEVDCENRKPKIDDIVPTPKPRDFVCPSKNGKYAHERDCGAFYLCEKKKYKLYYCKKGKLFHEKLRSCEDEEKVSCGNRIHPEMDPDEPEDEVVDPNPKFKCEKSHGRYNHEEYCDWYYNCRDKKASLRQCRQGRYYDSKERKCRDSKDVSCEGRQRPEDRENLVSTVEPTQEPEFKCPKSDGKYPHAKDCQKYYECKKGNYKLQTCPKKKLYDASRRSCEDDDHVMCGDRKHPDLEPEEPRDNVIDPNPNTKCKRNHGRFVHKEYCYWYYECHDKEIIIRECSRGKYFDYNKRKCLDAKVVSCEGRKERDGKEDEISTPGKEDEISTPVVPTQVPEFQCPKSDGKFPHEKDCQKYYECKKGNYKLKTCPKNKLYDASRRSCEDDDHVMCGNRIHPDLDPEEPQGNLIDPNPNIKCKKNHIRYVHKEYCYWYYECHDKKPTIRECRKGKYYDYKKRKCLDAKDVTCEGRKELDEFPSMFECPKTDGRYPHKRDCSKFYECKKKTYKVHDCPKKKLFDERKNKCEDEDNVICGKRIHPEDDPEVPEDKIIDPYPNFKCKKSHGRYLHQNCDKYYHCKDGKATLRECNRGKYFDQDRNACRNWFEVDCGDRTKHEDTTQTSSPSEASTFQQTVATILPEKKETSEEIIIPELSTVTETKQTFKETTPEQLSSTLLPETKEPLEEITGYDSTTSTGKEVTHPDPTKRVSTTLSPGTEIILDETSTIDHVSTTLKPSSKITFEDTSSTQQTSTTFVPETRESSPETTVTEQTSTTFVPETRESSQETTFTEQPSTVISELPGSTGSSEPSPPPTKAPTTNSDIPSTIESSQTPFEFDDNPDKIVDPNPKYDCASDESDFPHKTHCHYYYSCRKGRVTLRACPEGKYFDIHRESCEDWYLVTCGDRLGPNELDPPFRHKSTPLVDEPSPTEYPRPQTTEESQTPAPKFVCPQNEGFYPHEKNCEKYYLCINGNPEIRVCREGELYDVEKKTCNNEQETNCGERIHPMDDPDNPDKEPHKVIDPNPDFNCTKRHGCFTHEIFCKWYYYCHDNRPELRECAGDQYFDSVRNKCLDWWMAFCDDRIGPGGTTEKSRVTGITQTDSYSSGSPTRPTTIIDWITGSTFTRSSETEISDSDLLTKDFTESRNITEIDQSTTESGIGITRVTEDTNVETESTRMPSGSSRATDTTRIADRKTDSTGTWSRETAKDIEETTESGTGADGSTISSQSTDMTPSKDIETIDYVSKRTGGTGTTRDWREESTTATAFTTPDWSKSTGSSKDWSEKTKKDVGGTDATGSETAFTTPDWKKGTGSTSSWSEETKEGTGDDTGTSHSIDQETDVTGIATSTTSKLCESDGNYTHDKNCALYIQCKDGIETVVECAKGTLFNHIIKECFREDWVECDDRERPIVTKPDMEVTSTKNPISDVCEQEDGDFQHPEDCKRFYTCKDGEYEVYECPDGMLFDIIMRICYKEDHVNCGNRIRPEQTTPTQDDCDEWLRTRTTSPDDISTTYEKVTPGPPEKGTAGTVSTGQTSARHDETESTQITQSSTASGTDATKNWKTSSTSVDYSYQSTTLISQSTSESETQESGNPYDYTKTSDVTKEINESTEKPNTPLGSSLSTDENDKSTGTEFVTTESIPESTVSSDENNEEATEISTIRDESTKSSYSDEMENNFSTGAEGTTRGTSLTSDHTTIDHSFSTNSEDKYDLTKEIATASNSINYHTISTVSVKENTNSDETNPTNAEESSLSTRNEETPSTESITDASSKTGEDNTKMQTSHTNPSLQTTSSSIINFKTDITTASTDKESLGSTKLDVTIVTDNHTNKETIHEKEGTDNLSDSTISEFTDANTKTGTGFTITSTVVTDDNTSGNIVTKSEEQKSSQNPQTDNIKYDIIDYETTIESGSSSQINDQREKSTTSNENATPEKENTPESNITTGQEEYSTPNPRTQRTVEDETESTNSESSYTTLSTDSEISENTATEPKGDETTENPSTKSSDHSFLSTDYTKSLITESTSYDKEINSTIMDHSEDPETSTQDENEVTHYHTTQHPCLTHTHRIIKPTDPSIIDCKKDDIDCIIKKSGDPSKWYTCAKRRGTFPHPLSEYLFIQCKNWKPKMKKCGRNLIFSPKSMRCTRKN